MQILIVSQTVLAGVVVFVLGQLLLKMIIEPVQQLKRTMAEIANIFISYAYVIHNPNVVKPELQQEVFEKLRELSGKLYGDMALIPLYSIVGKAFFLPSMKNVYQGAKNLIAIANWMYGKESGNQFDHIIRNVQSACDNLGLYIAPEDRISEELLSK
ncbi:MAG: hypothetical protein Q8L39_08280 [Burkholderiales bacterium]|nr:hypothetical protein [Burkholderiales bacterium]